MSLLIVALISSLRRRRWGGVSREIGVEGVDQSRYPPPKKMAIHQETN
jgi:hypothetical protein